MDADLIDISDLTPFAAIDDAKAQAMVDDATAIALTVAPCLSDTSELSDQQYAAAKAVLRGAILRWNDAGSGAAASQTMGPFGMTLDTRTPRRAMFQPSEIVDLQRICQGTDTGSAFAIDTATANPQVVYPTFGGFPGSGGWYGGGQGGWAWNDNGTFIPNNF